MLSLTKPLWEQGFNLLVFDLRGHGESDGDHYSFGQHEQWDIVGAAEYIKNKGFAPGKIGVIGWSMGASSAIMALSDTPNIKAVVSDSAYAEYTTLSDWKFNDITGLPFLFYPGALVFDRLFLDVDLNQARPVQTIGNTGGRHLFLIHGTSDEVVPFSEFGKLIQAGKENVSETWVLPGQGHLDAFPRQPEEYIRRVTAFFDKELT
jgi:dipeptidyl aminopeptidase/acylaminoacyl peptidase